MTKEKKMNKTTNKKQNKKVIGVYLEERLRNKIKDSAKHNRRSVSAEAAIMLEDFINSQTLSKQNV